jgi:N-methylhydantoinase A
MLAFGGAGPVHACAVAEVLNSSAVIFPPLASVYSAFGSLVTPARLDLVRSGLSSLSALAWEVVAALFAEMEREGRAALSEAGCPLERITYRYAADMRYRGQHFELLVELAERPGGDTQSLRRAFEAAYLKIYKLVQPEVEVEVVNWRMTAVGAAEEAPRLEWGGGRGEVAQELRTVHLWRDDEMVRIFQRAALCPDQTIVGPALVEEAVTTLVIPGGWTATLGPLGSVVATRAKE